MSLRLTEAVDPEDESSHVSSSEEEEDDDTWDDFGAEEEDRTAYSLFEHKSFSSAAEALKYDKETHGFDLQATCSRLSLDFYGRIRLINFIRKMRPDLVAVQNLTGSEDLLCSEEFLVPVLENDALLQDSSMADWTDSEDELSQPIVQTVSGGSSNERKYIRRIRLLEERLKSMTQDLSDYRDLVKNQVDISRLKEDVSTSPSEVAKQQERERDDDSHYFNSYSYNDIHATMIQDKVRTSSYASFILSNGAAIFRDAVVMDIGCGTGILSLFAAKAGAKRVFAIDASDIAFKAEQIVQANGLQDVITVMRGKVENIQLEDGYQHVDIIISEWMGYALLYESMLDSVLHARDRFLKPDTGIMAPSHSRMLLSLCDATDIWKERIAFWDDVYGFDLSAMAPEVYDEAVVDIVPPESLLSKPVVVKDLHLQTIDVRQLDFSAPFTLTCNANRKSRVNAFVLHFDTFFTTTRVSIETDARAENVTERSVSEIWRVGSAGRMTRRPSEKSKAKEAALKANITSFSTGPQSAPTHWKQTIFLLRDPLDVDESSEVSGKFFCRKNAENSRELDVEIHHKVTGPTAFPQSGEHIVQMYKVR